MENFNKKFDCIVVGNSPSLVGTNLGDIIDSYKTIIRVNMCNVPDIYSDTGIKTHIWATSLYDRVQKKFNISKAKANSYIPPVLLDKEVWYRHPASRDYAKDFYSDNSINYKSITRPSYGYAVTGVMAILTAINRFKSIDIVGHTLYIESDGKTKTHNQDSYQEDGLITQRAPQVNMIHSFYKEGNLNLLNPKEKLILFQ